MTMERTSSGAWPAYYGGRCTTCNESFKVGTMVRWDAGKVVHDECEPAAVTEAAKMSPEDRQLYREAMCLKCFTVHAPGQEGCE